MGGVIGLSLWAVVSVTGFAGARQEMEQFAALRDTARLPGGALRPLGALDQHLSSAGGVRASDELQEHQARAPLAILRIPRIGLEVPVLEGTDAWTLNRGVGNIADTAKPGAQGNSGIAGHRDSHFRALKDVRPGDEIELETPEEIGIYRVERMWIVGPEDVSVLDPTPSDSVTLVTCYPFYFIGSAPERYIVRAVRTTSRGPARG